MIACMHACNSLLVDEVQSFLDSTVAMAFTTARPCATLVNRRQITYQYNSSGTHKGSLRTAARALNRLQAEAAAIIGGSSSSSSNQQQERLLQGAAAAMSAALLLLSPLPAHAVSGGGGISTPLSGADLSNQDLTKKSYTKAVLRKANFSGSKLQGVSFFSSLAEGANFQGADLTLADLESGNFEDANFTDAVLAGAFVNNAQLKGAKILNTDWSDVVLRKDMQMYLCSVAEGTNPSTGVDTRESLMCP